MTIRIKKDSIEFVDDTNGTTFTLKETNTGFTFDGAITSFWPTESMNTGSIAGFITGGTNTAGAGNSVIERIPFAAGTFNTTSIGNMVQAIGGRRNSGMSSKTHGFTVGGYIGPIGSSAKIERFPFTNASAGASDIGNLARGVSVNTTSHVYASGQIGFNSSGYNGVTGRTEIERIQFVTQQPAFIVGGMATSRGDCGAISSHSHGYFIAGYTTSPAPSYQTGEVLRFPFSGQIGDIANRVDANMLGWIAGSWIPSLPAGGNMSRSGYQTATAGILVGGQSPGGPIYTKSVYKFTWAADTNYNFVGDVDISNPVTGILGRNSVFTPFQSTEYGYATGIQDSGGTIQTWIMKFPFAAELAHQYIGDTASSHNSGSGHHF
jgi:hypothetical protein